jgi:hypothetical protein
LKAAHSSSDFEIRKPLILPTGLGGALVSTAQRAHVRDQAASIKAGVVYVSRRLDGSAARNRLRLDAGSAATPARAVDVKSSIAIWAIWVTLAEFTSIRELSAGQVTPRAAWH